MKRFILNSLIISALLIASSCGSDDDKEQKFFTGDCRQNVSLESGPAASTITTTPVTSSLDDMLKNSAGYGSPVSSGELLLAGSNTAVKVTGLPEGVSLNNFKININGIEQNFGEISNERANLNLYTSTYLDFFTRGFNKMISDKSLKTTVSFTPTARIGDEVQLEIVFSGKFSYWQKM